MGDSVMALKSKQNYGFPLHVLIALSTVVTVNLTTPFASAKPRLTPEQAAQAEWDQRRINYLRGAPKDRALGSREHPNMMREFGGPYNSDKLGGYIASIGGKMVANSEVPEEPFNFTLLNSRVINAFALPGGYVYISRQLLGLMNDEAELASVLGHETGHVMDRHTDRRQNQAKWGAIGQMVLMGIGAVAGIPQLGDVAQLFGQGYQMRLLKYSRDQEFKADELGQRYMARSGYDPFGAASMLASLGAQTSLEARLAGQDAERVPDWARTHPNSAERVYRAQALAQSTSATASGAKPRNRDAFLAAIDGMTMDDDAEQGFVRGQVFAHTKLMITFKAPDKFAMDNGPDAIQITGPNQVGALFSGGALAAGEQLDAHIARAWKRLAGEKAQALPGSRGGTINGIPSAYVATRVQQQNGSAVDVAIMAYKFDATTAYHFIVISPAELTGQIDGQISAMFNSFRRLDTNEARNYKERAIKVVTVQAGETAQSLSARMDYGDAPLDRFLILNGFTRAEDVRAGQKVKLVVRRN
jgi:predicted Zn-dependent protease